jgi:hypothetical protein
VEHVHGGASLLEGTVRADRSGGGGGGGGGGTGSVTGRAAHGDDEADAWADSLLRPPRGAGRLE